MVKKALQEIAWRCRLYGQRIGPRERLSANHVFPFSPRGLSLETWSARADL